MYIQKPLSLAEASWIIKEKIRSLSSRGDFETASQQALEPSDVAGFRRRGMLLDRLLKVN